MDKIIGSILDIENKAKNVVEDAKQEAEKIKISYQDEVKTEIEDIQNKAKKRLEDAKIFEEQRTKEKLRTISMSLEEKEKDMIQQFEQNKEQWSNTIFNNIIGR